VCCSRRGGFKSLAQTPRIILADKNALFLGRLTEGEMIRLDQSRRKHIPDPAPDDLTLFPAGTGVKADIVGDFRGPLPSRSLPRMRSAIAFWSSGVPFAAISFDASSGCAVTHFAASW
jgi:hypothetical protein